MQADFLVELSNEDPRLEVPWRSEDGRLSYLDLRARPELLLDIAETYENRELGEFLASVNSGISKLQSAKCDHWTTAEITEEEAIFGASLKAACYVDFFFHEPAQRFDFDMHEHFGSAFERLLAKVPEMPASAELFLRRCYFHRGDEHQESDAGFYFSLYVSGFGDEEGAARKHCAIALKVIQNALLQMGAGK